MSIDFKKNLWPPSDDSTFEEKLNNLFDGLDHVRCIAAEADLPVGDIDNALEIIKKLSTLFSVIEYGEPEHRQWLKQAIEAHFTGKPIPSYVAN